jgi:hypothetical protein
MMMMKMMMIVVDMKKECGFLILNAMNIGFVLVTRYEKVDCFFS